MMKYICFGDAELVGNFEELEGVENLLLRFGTLNGQLINLETYMKLKHNLRNTCVETISTMRSTT